MIYVQIIGWFDFLKCAMFFFYIIAFKVTSKYIINNAKKKSHLSYQCVTGKLFLLYNQSSATILLKTNLKCIFGPSDRILNLTG